MSTAAVERGGLLDLLLDRIGDSTLEETAQMLVLAAYEGDEELEQALEGAVHGEPRTPGRPGVKVPHAYLKSIEVVGFRGIGPAAALRLQPGPGLTLVVGRNGSGKSSFAEAAEVALTGTNARWTGRGVVWKEGWRNLHSPDVQPSVSAELVLDGEGGVTKVVRSWMGDDVDVQANWAQRPGQQREPVEALGWSEDLRAFRPFLSYAELGSMLLGKPSELHDALFSILGLEAVSSAQGRLKDVFRDLEDRAKALTADQKRLATDIDGLDDERAQAVVKALKGKVADLEALEQAVHAGAEQVDDLAPLQAWTHVTVPDADGAAAAADELESAAQLAAEMSGTESGRARSLAALLERALEHRKHATDLDCPVCGIEDRLDDAWVAATEAQILRLKQEAQAAEEAAGRLQRARAGVSALAMGPPGSLPAPPSGSDVREVWQRWAAAARGADVGACVAALREVTPDVVRQLQTAKEQAQAELSRREDVWQPVVERVAAFLANARVVAGERSLRAHVKEAADWLRGQADGIRDDRLAPITDQAGRIWQLLRQESNIELGPVRLEGNATRRRVTLDVTVDGIEGAALGVMSQGELHALALSLFLPRAMLAESPFRFLVIDDPVQAMDPAKVDGLARVLHEVAATHQVVVFTHDDRLAEAVRRLQVPATVWQVVRRERSVVELQKVTDPVSRYLDDARALAKSTELPAPVSGRVVPGLCRSAIEAVCHELVRKRRLDRGDGHADVEDALASAKTTNQMLALALFDDVDRGGDVLARLNSYGRWAGDAFQVSRKGVHTSYSGDLLALVQDTDRLVKKLRT